jgi:hypothetical protein
MDITHLKHYPPEKVRALFGLTLSALGTLLAKVLPELGRRRQVERTRRPERRRAVGGGRRRCLKPYQEVLLTLVYLRHNVAHAVVGELFGVSADTSENTFHEVVFVLRDVCPAQRWDAEKRWKKSEPSWTPSEVERVLIDSFESPVRRPSLQERQKRVYSGKKKRHTLKTQVATDQDGEILTLEAGQRGPQADLKLYEAAPLPEPIADKPRMGDKGYYSQDHPELTTPHKKPRGGELTVEQEAENKGIARQRSVVEHGIRRIKGFRLLRDDYRLALGLFPMIASAVVGLIQFSRIAR